jgi:hypothetical protein
MWCTSHYPGYTTTENNVDDLCSMPKEGMLHAHMRNGALDLTLMGSTCQADSAKRSSGIVQSWYRLGSRQCSRQFLRCRVTCYTVLIRSTYSKDYLLYDMIENLNWVLETHQKNFHLSLLHDESVLGVLENGLIEWLLPNNTKFE